MAQRVFRQFLDGDDNISISSTLNQLTQAHILTISTTIHNIVKMVSRVLDMVTAKHVRHMCTQYDVTDANECFFCMRMRVTVEMFILRQFVVHDYSLSLFGRERKNGPI